MNTEQIVITGFTDTGAYHRAIDIARMMKAAGVWDGKRTLVIHNPYKLHGQLAGVMRRDIHTLQPGIEYEVL